MIRQTIRRAHAFVRPHAPQFLRYLMSGGGAAATEILAVHLLSMASVIPEISGPVSSIVGVVCAFLFHKYFAFQAHQNTGRQTIRYAILTVGNFVVQNAIFLLLVKAFGVHPTISKTVTIGCSVSWNFLLYKFFVYA